MGNDIQSSLFFEDNYLRRTLGKLVKRYDIALVELVANAWDSGATHVSITLPDGYGGKLTVRDNGEGLSKEEFEQRWMTLAYDRIKNQGAVINFDENNVKNRKPYGKNGQGRHGLLCFNSEYSVLTTKNGVQNTFVINTSGSKAFNIISHTSTEVDKTAHGTTLEVIVNEHLPNKEKLAEVLAARFLYDPGFTITINGNNLHLERTFSSIKNRVLVADNNGGQIKLEVQLIDLNRVQTRMNRPGIAIWQDNRLVGKPSWVLGDKQVIDARTHLAKSFLVVVKTSDLGEYILPDWTGFKDEDVMTKVFDTLYECVDTWLMEVARESVEDLTDRILKEFEEDIERLPRIAKSEAKEYTKEIATKTYGISNKVRHDIVEAFLKMQRSTAGQQLLQKLLLLDESDYKNIKKILDNWSTKDALSVLDAIDFRLNIIEAIKRYCSDNKIDELHVLHPLITEARWLFGPEYESAEYASNRTLKNAVNKVFKVDTKNEDYVNYKNRPDLLVTNEFSISVTGCEDFKGGSEISYIRRVLLLELKKGGFKVSYEELSQIQRYILELIKLPELRSLEQITAYLIGYEIDELINLTSVNVDDKGMIYVVTYNQLVDTAYRRLFNIKNILSERYDSIDDITLMHKLDESGIVTLDNF